MDEVHDHYWASLLTIVELVKFVNHQSTTAKIITVLAASNYLPKSWTILVQVLSVLYLLWTGFNFCSNNSWLINIELTGNILQQQLG